MGLVSQQGLLPGKSDARLWAVQCRPGSEREAVICLLQKAVELGARNERLGMAALGIKSAFAHDHIKVGKVGVCAFPGCAHDHIEVGTAAFGRRKQEVLVHLCNERLGMAALGIKSALCTTTSRWVLFNTPGLQRS